MSTPQSTTSLFSAGGIAGTAVHESSHVVVAARLGVRFNHATLRPTDPNIRGEVNGLDLTRPPAAVATVLLAGTIGELAVWQPGPGASLVASIAEAAAIAATTSRADFALMARVAPDIVNDPDLLSDHTAVATHLVYEHRRAIAEVAAALLHHPRQTLSAEQVAEIVQRTSTSTAAV